jgi:hypothetical protein
MMLLFLVNECQNSLTSIYCSVFKIVVSNHDFASLKIASNANWKLLARFRLFRIWVYLCLS